MGLNFPSSVSASSPICGSFHDRSSTLYYHRIYITTLVQPSVQHSRIIVRIAFSHQLCFYTCILHIIAAYHYCFNNKCSIMYIRISELSLSIFCAFNNPESKPLRSSIVMLLYRMLCLVLLFVVTVVLDVCACVRARGWSFGLGDA